MVCSTQNYRVRGVLDEIRKSSTTFKVFLTYNVVPGMVINNRVFIENSFYYIAI
jgi:hypothetical protein